VRKAIGIKYVEDQSMKYDITQTTLTSELKASIYEAFAKHAMDSAGDAFAFGKENGCHFAVEDTMSFQAPEFDQKLGFEIELKREGYAAGASFYYLKKVL